MTNTGHFPSRHVLGTLAPEQGLPEGGRKKVAGHICDLSPAYRLPNHDMADVVYALPYRS